MRAAMAGDLYDLTDSHDRKIRSDLIRAIMADEVKWPRGGRVDPRGINLKGADLVGALNLDHVESNVPLVLSECNSFDGIYFSWAQLRSLDLTGLNAPVVCGAGASIACDLIISRASVAGDKLLTAVNLQDVRVCGNLDLSACRIKCGSAEYSKERAMESINKALRLGEDGAVRLLGANVSGMVNLDGASVISSIGTAIQATNFSAGGSVFFGAGFRAQGRGDRGVLRLSGAKIGGQAVFLGGKACATGSNSVALDMRHMKVSKEVLLSADFACFSSTPHDISSWSSIGIVRLDGMSYGSMPRRSKETASLGEWLEILSKRTPSYASQPYMQLAAVHQAAGHEKDARKIRILQQADLLIRGDLPYWSRMWHRVTGITVGYGYRPGIALLWLLMVLASAMLLIIGIAGPLDLVLRNSSTGSVRCLVIEQAKLALDSVIPLIKTNNIHECKIDYSRNGGKVIIVCTWLLQALAWSLATLFVAGFTGLMKKK